MVNRHPRTTPPAPVPRETVPTPPDAAFEHTGGVWAALLHGAATVGDAACGGWGSGWGLPVPFPKPGGFADDAAALAADGRRAVRITLPPDALAAAEADDPAPTVTPPQ